MSGRAAAEPAVAPSSAMTDTVVRVLRIRRCSFGRWDWTPPTFRPAGPATARTGIAAVKPLLTDPELIQQRPELDVHLRVADAVRHEQQGAPGEQRDRGR